ncbi:hypothetical protein [Chengkuizengella sediminis]|uniref:hypothetical protein n=1 Tax=Chengkuizengella sediminis TaxID=1885917 RepID=UPI0013898BE5|nr:hypothetical protein [Chengkuizengella sediminis]NDI34655.1 hypothetical protein [Chengkuizengella sediminis]
MGHFDETICDCCVCPMQCVLKQLIREEVVQIETRTDSVNLQITEVKNFIVSGIDDGTGEVVHFPICNISAVFPRETFSLELKPIKKSTKGECVCCEDPITNLANSLKGETVFIDYIGGGTPAIIRDVGEGIVIGEDTTGSGLIVAITSCAITEIREGSVKENDGFVNDTSDEKKRYRE